VELLVRRRCHVTHSSLQSQLNVIVVADNRHERVEQCLALLPPCCGNPLLKVGDVGRMTVMDSLIKPVQRLSVTKPLPRKVGVLPDKNETLIRRAEPSSDEIVECVQITVPRHRQVKDSGKLSSALGQCGESAAVYGVTFLGGRSVHARPSRLTMRVTDRRWQPGYAVTRTPQTLTTSHETARPCGGSVDSMVRWRGGHLTNSSVVRVTLLVLASKCRNASKG
jgi:hypothetical protein